MAIGDLRFESEQLPERVDLVPSRVQQLKRARVVVATGVLVWWLIPGNLEAPFEGDKLRWVAAIYCGVLFVGLVSQMIPQISSLRLTPLGFQVRQFGDRIECRWVDCSEFRNDPLRGSVIWPVIVCRRPDDTELHVPVFGMLADDLAALMNRFRDRALAEAAT